MSYFRAITHLWRVFQKTPKEIIFGGKNGNITRGVCVSGSLQRRCTKNDTIRWHGPRNSGSFRRRISARTPRKTFIPIPRISSFEEDFHWCVLVLERLQQWVSFFSAVSIIFFIGILSPASPREFARQCQRSSSSYHARDLLHYSSDDHHEFL